MNNDTTVPAPLMQADFGLEPKKQSGIHPILKILLGAVVLLLLLVLFKR